MLSIVIKFFGVFFFKGNHQTYPFQNEMCIRAEYMCGRNDATPNSKFVTSHDVKCKH